MRPIVLSFVVFALPNLAIGQETLLPSPTLLGQSVFAGAEGFHVPSWDGPSVEPSQVGGQKSDAQLLGSSFGMSILYRLPGPSEADATGLSPFFLEWSGQIAVGAGQTSQTQTYSGTDALLLTSGRGPTAGTIDLTTSTSGAGASANGSLTLTDNSGDTASIVSSAFSPTGNNSVAQSAVSVTQSGGAFVALTTNGIDPASAAFGFIADETGYALVGVGDLSGTSVIKTSAQSIALGSQKFFFSRPFQLADGWSVTPRLGPTYTLLARTVAHSTMVDINEGPNVSSALPLIGLTETDGIFGHYLGINAGASISGQIAEHWRLSFGAEAGLSGYFAQLDSSASVALPGAPDIALARSFASIQGLTTYGRASGGISFATGSGFVVGLSAHIDRIGDVPFVKTTQVSAPNAAFGAGDTQVSYASNGSTYYEKSLSTAPMWAGGVSFSITGRF